MRFEKQRQPSKVTGLGQRKAKAEGEAIVRGA
jgi:hypothetical protein